MKRILFFICMALFTSYAFAADDVVSAVTGTVKAVDAGSKTFVLETGKGVRHTFHYTDEVTVHGAKDVAKAPDEAFKGVKDGSRVAVHYTGEGGKETAHEVVVIGRDGLKASKGTVVGIDRGSKFLAIKTADGGKETFKLSDRAAVDSGKGIAKGTVKTAKVTVYYTEDAGKKIAHFFEE